MIELNIPASERIYYYTLCVLFTDTVDRQTDRQPEPEDSQNVHSKPRSQSIIIKQSQVSLRSIVALCNRYSLCFCPIVVVVVAELEII